MQYLVNRPCNSFYTGHILLLAREDRIQPHLISIDRSLDKFRSDCVEAVRAFISKKAPMNSEYLKMTLDDMINTPELVTPDKEM